MNKDFLEKAIPLDLGLTLYRDYAKYIVNIIYDHLFDKNDGNSIKRHDALVMIIANLRLAYDQNVPLRYSRNKNAYKNSVVNYGMGYKNILLCIDTLLLKGLVEQSRFFFNRVFGDNHNRQTRMWCAHNLISIFDPIQPRDVIKEPPQLIQLREPLTKEEKRRGKIAKQLSYPITEQILLMEKQIVDFHHLLESNHICVDIPAREVLNDKSSKLINEFSRSGLIHAAWTTNNRNTNSDNTPPVPSPTNTKAFFITMRYYWLYRVFTGSFDLGGRYYGGAWQNLPEQIREYIKINLEPTIELDYSNFNARLLYHKEGADYSGDAYTCGSIPRKLFKTATIALLNCHSKNYYYVVSKAFRDKELHYKYPGCLLMKNVMPIIDAIHDKHPTITKYFASGKALETQRLDSTILSNILDRFISNGIVALPVHDSLIVQHRFEDELRTAMVEEYGKIMGFVPVID